MPEVLKTAFGAMASQPLALGLVVVVVILLYLLHDLRQSEIKAAHEYQSQITELLSKCGPR